MLVCNKAYGHRYRERISYLIESTLVGVGKNDYYQWVGACGMQDVVRVTYVRGGLPSMFRCVAMYARMARIPGLIAGM